MNLYEIKQEFEKAIEEMCGHGDRRDNKSYSS